MQAISGNWMKSEVTPVWMGRWWIHFVMLAMGGVLVYLKSHKFDLARRQLLARWRS
jgi:lipopolysaccharide export system permease protein